MNHLPNFRISLVALLVAPIFLILTACDGDEGEGGKDLKNSLSDRNTHTLIFIDKSASVQVDEETAHQQESALLKLLHEAVQGKGDRLDGYHIHSNTGDQPFKKHVCQAFLPDTASMDHISKLQAKQTFQGALSNERQTLKKELTEVWKSSSEGRSVAQSTNIWPILEVMTRFFPDSSSGDKCQVVIFSDMIHADGKGTDLRKLKNREDAETAARNHAQQLRQSLKIDEQRLHNVAVHIGFPSGAMEASRNQLMKYYWEALFNEFGMGSPIYF